MVSRTGFTGDLGYELWIDNSRALALWDALFDKGAIHGIRPMGTHALEIARIEAGFLQAHVDFLPADQAIIRTARARRSSSISGGWWISRSPTSTAAGRCSKSRSAARATAS